MTWWAALAQGLSSAAGGTLGYFSQNETNKQNYKIWQESQEFSKEMQDRQNAETWKMWNAENQYNSPENQRKLWEEGGFSPYAALGTDSTAGSMTSASGSTPEAPTMQSPLSALVDPVTQLFDASLRAVQSYKQLKKTDEEIRKESALADDAETTRDLNKISFGYNVDKAKHESRVAEFTADLAEIDRDVARKTQGARVRKIESEADKMEHEADLTEATLLWQQLDNQQKQLFVDTYGVQRSMELTTMLVSLSNSIKTGELTDKQIQHKLVEIINEGKKGKLLDEQIEGQDIANQSAQEDLTDKRNTNIAKWGSTPEETNAILHDMFLASASNAGVDSQVAQAVWNAAMRASGQPWEDAADDSYYQRLVPGAYQEKGGLDVEINLPFGAGKGKYRSGRGYKGK